MRWSSTPAAAGAANTRTFLVHCFGRAVRRSPRSATDARRGRDGAGRRSRPVGSGTADIARGAPRPPLAAPAAPVVDSGGHGSARSTHARATTAAPGCSTAAGSPKDAPGPDGLRHDRRGGRRARSRPAETEPRRRAQRAARPAAARAVRRRRRARDRARQPAQARRRASRSSPPRWSTALEPIIDDITDRFEPPTRVRAPRREPRRRRARPRAHGRAARRARVGRRDRRDGWLEPESQVVPYLNRLADLVLDARPLAGRRVPPGATGPTSPNSRRTRPTTRRRLSCPSPSRSSSTAADRSRADLLAVPVFAAGASSAPAPTSSTPRSAAACAAFMDEAGFEGKPGQTLAVPTNGALGAKAAVLVGPRRARRAHPRRRAQRAGARSPGAASKVASVATTLLDAAPGARSSAARRAGARRGRRARRLPVPRVQGRGRSRRSSSR